jgi:hypothetical protein
MKTNRDNYILLFFGVVLGIAVSILSVIIKDEVVYYNNCDGAVVKTFSGARHCIDPSILEGGK